MIVDLISSIVSFVASPVAALFLADPSDGGFELFNMKVWDEVDFLKLVFRLTINLVFVTVLVRYIYYPVAKRKDFLFTYVLISLSIFLLCFSLENVNLDMGVALGLFAIFGIIRYRTDAIPIKEMTYLFIVIAISALNALVNKKISLAELLLSNVMIVLVTYGLEKIWLLRHEQYKTILYERIDLIRSGNHDAMKQDLEERTGIHINRVEIGKIDFLRDTAQLRIYYYEDAQPGHLEE